ncbi:hypothetical protein ES319_A01G183300v1 [Gossypium barbadense]|uniref:Uncharacterized protein n=1 Tax=Gossypium barbadense TaxID=3634 RepID=A0A2P5WKL7_GOSBA|nr:hypothetical protein ES319_A01G183300v1 [Gossypium barbadense]PPR91615.1 hypothetical protein GOBAR_AA29070 [Gossypium barbadense]
MAASPLNVQPSFHDRSNSLPSRQHPITSQIDENLNRLRASQFASTSSSSIGHELTSLAQEQQRKSVEQLLDASLVLLDVCGTAKDALVRTKECTQELQSVLHRRRGGFEGLGDEVRKYLTSKREVRKAISKASKNLKHMDNKLMSKDGETGAVISTLKQVVAATMGVLQSLLYFISGPEASSRWSLVSKLMHQKRVRCEEEEEKTNAIANAEAALRSFIKSGNVKHIENVQNEIQNSELCIQDLEEGLESFFRRWIKARVTVLNIVNC